MSALRSRVFWVAAVVGGGIHHLLCFYTWALADAHPRPFAGAKMVWNVLSFPLLHTASGGQVNAWFEELLMLNSVVWGTGVGLLVYFGLRGKRR